MAKTLTTIAVMLSLVLATSVATEAAAQSQGAPPAREAPAQGDEQVVSGQVKNIHPNGTELTLTDGTRLVAPAGAVIRPGVLSEGMMVIASYRDENGEKVMTNLAVREPSASPPSEPPSGKSAPTTPPADVPKR
jgi:Protein of unknown function (DUF1344)